MPVKDANVVSTEEPGRRRSDSENGDSLDSIVNGLEVHEGIEIDNEAFGIVSNEMAAHAGTATVGPAVNITNPAHAEEVAPTMEAKEEQDTEKQVSDDEPKLAPIDNDINNSEPEETAPAEMNGSGEDDSGTTDGATVPIEKHFFSTEVQPNSDDTTSLDAPAEEPSPTAVDSVVDNEQRKLDEPLPTEQLLLKMNQFRNLLIPTNLHRRLKFSKQKLKSTKADDPSASSAVSVFSTVSSAVEDNTTPVLDNFLEKN
ncbi:serine/threonine-protein phosphatase 4 regulatory subunit 2-like [Armigeres subalbatus]|uniref:serine/threonine-protein phosphatase 4 regulatory subunit 2-like n=1 Tax=Armigeres subalbatus TaxID=124917 RepID=UPI002ED1B263